MTAHIRVVMRRPKPTPGALIWHPWSWLKCYLKWPGTVRRLKAGGWHRTGWMTWETGGDGDWDRTKAVLQDLAAEFGGEVTERSTPWKR